MSIEYSNGITAKKNDRVLVNGKRRAYIQEVLRPHTKVASDYGCHESGGVLIVFDDGDVQVWLELDEDIELVPSATDSASNS